MTERTLTADSEHSETSRRGPAWWVVAVVGVIAAGLGLGLGYLVFGPTTSEADVSSVSTEEADRVVALLDAYETAWNANDPDAVLDLFADDYVYADGHRVETSKPVLARGVAQSAKAGAQWEYVGDPVVIPHGMLDDGTYHVSAPWASSHETSSEAAFGITVFRVVDEDGVLKIQRSRPDDDWFPY